MPCDIWQRSLGLFPPDYCRFTVNQAKSVIWFFQTNKQWSSVSVFQPLSAHICCPEGMHSNSCFLLRFTEEVCCGENGLFQKFTGKWLSVLKEICPMNFVIFLVKLWYLILDLTGIFKVDLQSSNRQNTLLITTMLLWKDLGLLATNFYFNYQLIKKLFGH